MLQSKALALSTQQVERSREQVRTGKVAESVLYENEALLAADEYKLTQSRNDLSLSLLALEPGPEPDECRRIRHSRPDFRQPHRGVDASPA